ncbi:ABC transporter permease [Roseospira marina]|uniref:ABC transporter permease n=1 Tax=Roseospira marina TaxID=140057 RepID=A0A5M6IBK3_9PROT|nr:ABC transporter permease [Roseospira marina]KAA5605337.1 ABC transporter permease [Roseospira marina]MBB4314810.1 ribose transport system permease protein [Roseospira marina]MBB5087799.1 ribose transport system permease protein [Roseospira marina]
MTTQTRTVDSTVRSGKPRLQRLFGFKESGILLALIGMCVLISLITPNFLTPYNLAIVMRQVSFIGIVAAGQTLVLLLGGIDLSVGAIAGLSAVLGAMLMTAGGLDPFVAMTLAIALGFLFGLINGVLIAYLKLNAFIVTLATGEVFAGAILVLTRGYAITGLPPEFAVLGQGSIGVVPVSVVFLFAIFAVLVYMSQNTPFGRSIFAIGGNRVAARFVGLRVERVEMTVYAIAGMLAATAGMLFVSRMSAGQPTIGASWLMPSITAAIIGGTSLSGGVGTVLGTLLGATFMGVLANGIVLTNVSSYWERVIIGLFVIIAVFVDMFRRRSQGRALVPAWMMALRPGSRRDDRKPL